MWKEIACTLLLLVAAARADSWELLDYSADHAIDQSAQLSSGQPELNWPPVADGELQVVQPPVERSVEIDSDELSLPADRCPAPNNGGPRQLLRELRPLLPLRRLKLIVKSALRRDTQMRALRDLIRTPRFRANVRALHKAPEVRQLREAACRRAYLDLRYYSKFAHDVFHMHFDDDDVDDFSFEDTVGDSVEEIFQGRPGFSGVCQDLAEALPRAQLRSVYQRRYESDPDLRRAIQALRSDEFSQILRNIEGRREYQENRAMIRNLGVRLEELQRVIDIALGWRKSGEDNSKNVALYMISI